MGKTYTIIKTPICHSGYGLYECEDDKCKLIACVNYENQNLSTPLFF